MSLYITSLNSGSNGNCYYIGNDREAILVDAGLSCRETEKRMRRLGLSLDHVKAIFVSHEHDDHIRGIPIIAKKYQLPVYITSGTLEGWGFGLESHLVYSFSAYTPVMIGTLKVTAFPKFHDAADPHSFIISHETGSHNTGSHTSGSHNTGSHDTGPQNTRSHNSGSHDTGSLDKGAHNTGSGENGAARISTVVGVFTDIGAPCEHLVKHFRQCHAAFLETNYDEAMLDKGSYPFHLKRRIRGGQGHLSNNQALELFLTHRPPFMSHLFLSHLSQNNNDPDLVQDLFNGQSGGVRIVLASRYEETALYTIEGRAGDVATPWVETTSTPTFDVHTSHTEVRTIPGEARTPPASRSAKKQAIDPRQMSLF